MFDAPANARPKAHSHHRTAPRPLGDLKDHYWLVQRMAQANGTDLVAAYEEGHLDQAEWARMVGRCRGCTWTGGCQRWLGQTDGAERDTPHDCVNHAYFAELQAKLKDED